MRLSLFLLFVLLSLAACRGGESAQPVPLTGSWQGTEPGGTKQTFLFGTDGEALWIFDRAGERDTFIVRYAFDRSSTPHAITLRGFERGPLAGQALYGILSFDDSAHFRLDLEPGPLEGDAETIRPDSFDPQQTITYRRAS